MTRDRSETRHATFRPERAVAAGSPACLVQVYGGQIGRRVVLGKGGLLVGRDELDGFGLDDPAVSRRHARIFGSGGGFQVEDLGSTNGTYVNEVEIKAAQQLRNGDFVRCGGVVLKFIEGGNIEALYHEEIYRLAITDGLTQLANKRCLLEFLEREVARAQRHGRPLSVLVADVDHFKKVNDTHGHLVGDKVLKAVADACRGLVRRDELLARYGGEEFVLVLPETALDNAARFAERIREAVAAEAVQVDGADLKVTVSLGAAQLRDLETGEALLGRADSCLYRAKEAGRNRVVAWDW